MTNKINALKITPKNIAFSLLAIVAWWIFWMSSQALYMIDVPLLSDIRDSGNLQQQFIVLTLWITGIAIITTLIWHISVHDYSFLRGKKWQIALYVIPLMIMVMLFATHQTGYGGIDLRIYILGMVVSTFCQDILTTGFLQTALTKTIGDKFAAVVTAIMFFLGHFMTIAQSLSPMGAIMICGFVLFSWLRYKTGNIYIVNVIHLTFSLIAK